MGQNRRRKPGPPRNTLHSARYAARYVGELVQILDGTWEPMTLEQGEALQEMKNNPPDHIPISEVDQNNARWVLVTSQEFVDRALPEFWALAKMIREERARLARCDRSINAP